MSERYVAEEYGGTSLKDVLASRLHLDTGHVVKRLHDAEVLGPRWSFTGEALPPVLKHTAAGLARGELALEHVQVIRKAIKGLPGWVDEATRGRAERDLAHHGAGLRPADLERTAERLDALIDPDGAEPNDDLQARQRGIYVGRQQADGISRVSGYLDPETRALWDVVAAKEAAPGANVPDGDA